MVEIGNDVLLLGGSHHNGLGLVRSFGIHGVEVYGIIIGYDAEKSFIRKSKYWKKTWAVENEEQAIKLLERIFGERKEKLIVIPWSDGAAAAIDKNLERLSKFCVLPNINGEEGKIFSLMDKFQQVEFCRKIGIDMLETGVIEDFSKTIELKYPVILKPVASVEGDRGDIRICYNASQCEAAQMEYKDKGYLRVLVQRYLEKKEEYVLTGAIFKEQYSYTVSKSIRQWPIHRGCGSFSKFETDESILEWCSKILRKIQEIGYVGPLDLEFFKDVEGKIYLNEINWRSSGRNFVDFYTGVFSAYQYYCDILDIAYAGKLVNKKEGFSMNEGTDIRHVLNRNIKLKDWVHDIRKTQSFSIWYSKDNKPFVYRILYYVKKVIGIN